MNGKIKTIGPIPCWHEVACIHSLVLFSSEANLDGCLKKHMIEFVFWAALFGVHCMCHKMPSLKFSENFENVNFVRTSSIPSSARFDYRRV